MRLVPSFSVLIAVIAALFLAGGCAAQTGQNPISTISQPLAVPSEATSPTAATAPTAISLSTTAFPVATPSVPAVAPTTTPQPAPTPSPIPSPQPATTGVAYQSLSLPKSPSRAEAAQSAAPPVRVEIPSVGVSAGVENLGLTPDGGLDAPKNPDRVGWYDLGPKPGENGNALVDGHVDWAGKVRAFWYLQRLRPGDNIIVTDANGDRHEFAVQWARWYDQYAPVAELFAQSDQPELTLITCGGQFDPATHRYLSRLAVRAELR